MTLLVANRWDIRRVTLSNNRYTAIVKGLHNAIALDFHHRKGLMFWSDVSTDVIKMVYMNGTRVRDVIKWEWASLCTCLDMYLTAFPFWPLVCFVWLCKYSFRGYLLTPTPHRDL